MMDVDKVVCVWCGDDDVIVPEEDTYSAPQALGTFYSQVYHI